MENGHKRCVQIFAGLLVVNYNEKIDEKELPNEPVFMKNELKRFPNSFLWVIQYKI